jgi:hypothetical protein
MSTATQEQTWIDARTKIVSILVNNGVLDTHNGMAGFWSHDGFGTSTWISIYDILEYPND